MRFLFVYTLRSGLTADHPLLSLAEIHFGISYLAACIGSQGHQTRLAVLASDAHRMSLKTLEAKVAGFQPDVVAFTSVSTQYPFVEKAASLLRARWPDIQLIIGGVHSSVDPARVIHGPCNVVCVGEGELALADFAKQLQAGLLPHGIPNLWIKRPDGTVEKNAPRPFLSDLGQLPFPDREIWHDWVLQNPLTHHAVLCSRGCPYNCSYCSNHVLRKIAPGQYVRLRPPSNILQEIGQIKRSYSDTTDIYLQSETITLDLGWLKELTGLIKSFNESQDRRIAFACNFRPERRFLTQELFKALADANVRTLEIGLESGSERLRSTILRRHYSNDEFFQAVALARQHAMRVNVYNMIGLPEETPADHQMTVEVNRKANPDRSYTSIFYPYPGTDLFACCRTKGLIVDVADPTAERARASVDFPQFPRRKVQKAYDWFDYKIYRGHHSFAFRIRKVLRNKIAARRWTNSFFTRLLPLWYAVKTWRHSHTP